MAFIYPGELISLKVDYSAIFGAIRMRADTHGNLHSVGCLEKPGVMIRTGDIAFTVSIIRDKDSPEQAIFAIWPGGIGWMWDKRVVEVMTG